VGVNNRNLSTFVTDVDTSARLAALIPDTFVKVAESGLQHASTILELRQAGYQGFLIGETFMKTSNPAAALKELVGELTTPVSAS
jgi:indole-3-glycerol phosphate synthase